MDPIPPLTVSLIEGSSPPRWRLARGEHGVATYPTREEAEAMLGKSLIAEASQLLNRVVAEACGGAWDPAKRDAWMRDWTAFQGRSADRLFTEPPNGSMARVKKERDVARLTVAQWDRMHAVCKETLGGRPGEFLPMVCSRVKGERDDAMALLKALAEAASRAADVIWPHIDTPLPKSSQEWVRLFHDARDDLRAAIAAAMDGKSSA